MGFGAILAGGLSARFGGLPKALVRLGGVPVLTRICSALEAAGYDCRLITNSPDAYTEFGLPWRRDAIPGGGPASGIHTALRWAEAEGRNHALCVACDMPFLSADLVRELGRRAESSDAHVVVPRSPGPLGFEPLCAVYSTRTLEALEGALAGGSIALVTLLESLRLEMVSVDEVRAFGDPGVIFRNVNTREELAEAAAILAPRRRR
jgi:molybdenum cofactor guanylyltransferase